MATRFYLPSGGTAPLAALGFSSSWEDTTIGARLPTFTTKQASAMTTVAFLDNNASSRDILFRQYQSLPIEAVTIIAQTLELQIRGQLTSAGTDMFISMGARVVSGDGTVVRGTLFDVTRDDNVLTTTLTNRRFTITTTEVIAFDGDRLIFEIGTGGDPSGTNDHDSNIRIGDADASDLPQDNTDVNDFNPWIEFSQTFNFFNPIAAQYIQGSYKNIYRGIDIN